MAELIELDKNQYEHFVKNHPLKSHFLQSFYWGAFSRKRKNLTPYYLGLMKKNQIIGACLLLQKKLPFGYSYFYSPRGFVIDFFNPQLVKEMTRQVLLFTKKHHSIFLKIDPDIIYKKYNYLNEEVALDYDPIKVFTTLTKLGFHHLGFTKNFETMQPRYTFRIDLEQDMDTIMHHFSKTTNQRIHKAESLGCTVELGSIKDMDTFYHLMTLTEARKDFVSYSKEYYKEQYQILNEQGMAQLFLGNIHIKQIIKNLNKELKTVEEELGKIDSNSSSKSSKNKLQTLITRKSKLLKDRKQYQSAQEKYGDMITLNAHMIITYGNKAWVLYAGNHNILTDSYANYLTYYRHLSYCKEQGIKIYDQFGTIGDLSKENPRLGLHEFKKKFGGDYIEFLGEFDYVQKKLMYVIFTKLVPFYRRIVRKRSKKEVTHEVKRNQ